VAPLRRSQLLVELAFLRCVQMVMLVGSTTIPILP
jgi:hypothetical protein